LTSEITAVAVIEKILKLMRTVPTVSAAERAQQELPDSNFQ
jgi:hypothetical protein